MRWPETGPGAGPEKAPVEYCCAICGAGFDRQRARRDKARARVGRKYNKSRHLWLDRFRLLGKYRTPDDNNPILSSYMSGQCEVENDPKGWFKGAKHKPGYDERFPDSGVGELIYVYTYDRYLNHHLAFPAHDACLLIFARTLAYVRVERKSSETGDSIPFPVKADHKDKVDPRVFVDVAEYVTSFNKLSMQYFELDRLSEFPYGRMTMAVQGHYLDPLTIPELQQAVKSPPMVVDRPDPPNNYLSQLPVEISAMIMSHLSPRTQALLICEGFTPDAAAKLDWRTQLQEVMPYLWEFEALDWANDDIDFAKLFFMCFSDVRKMGIAKVAAKLSDAAVAMRDIDDIEDPAEKYARQLYPYYTDVKELPEDLSLDFADIDTKDSEEYTPPLNDGLESEDEWEKSPIPTAEREQPIPRKNFDKVAFPNFPGLSNRRRIWKICLPMADAYIRNEDDRPSPWDDTDEEDDRPRPFY